MKHFMAANATTGYVHDMKGGKGVSTQIGRAAELDM